jgi:hypothetical protein
MQSLCRTKSLEATHVVIECTSDVVPSRPVQVKSAVLILEGVGKTRPAVAREGHPHLNHLPKSLVRRLVHRSRTMNFLNPQQVTASFVASFTL